MGQALGETMTTSRSDLCLSCAHYGGHPDSCPVGQMERRDARIAALEEEVAKMSTALGLVVGRVFPQFEDPEVAKLLEKMKAANKGST